MKILKLLSLQMQLKHQPKLNKWMDTQGYFIYISPVKELRKKVLDSLYDQYKNGKKNPTCVLVNGATQKITVNLQDIFLHSLTS
jgi:hypothetical protein